VDPERPTTGWAVVSPGRWPFEPAEPPVAPAPPLPAAPPDPAAPAAPAPAAPPDPVDPPFGDAGGWLAMTAEALEPPP
jgi:hypothetical protein